MDALRTYRLHDRFTHPICFIGHRHRQRKLGHNQQPHLREGSDFRPVAERRPPRRRARLLRVAESWPPWRGCCASPLLTVFAGHLIVSYPGTSSDQLILLAFGQTTYCLVSNVKVHMAKVQSQVKSTLFPNKNICQNNILVL
jgi:hypothetical protein